MPRRKPKLFSRAAIAERLDTSTKVVCAAVRELKLKPRQVSPNGKYKYFDEGQIAEILDLIAPRRRRPIAEKEHAAS